MKPKKVFVFLFVFFLMIWGVVLVKPGGDEFGKIPGKTEKETTKVALKEKSPSMNVDSLFVIHFHPTIQCSCCINVGNFAKKGLEKYYAKPYKEGRIIYRECNIDEDSTTAKKYKIFWSALGFEKFSRGKNEFKEIESVWQFCEDEKKYLLNFKKEMDQFIDPSKKDKSAPKTQSKTTE